MSLRCDRYGFRLDRSLLTLHNAMGRTGHGFSGSTYHSQIDPRRQKFQNADCNTFMMNDDQ